MHIAPQYIKEDLHTSALSGCAWLNELLVGHPDRIYIALGMRQHVFLALVFLMGVYRDDEIDFGRLATSLNVTPVEKRRAEGARDRIAQAMWDDYQQYLADQMQVDHDYYGDMQAEAVD
ncbi:hypothetical protein B0H10DRAFT_1858515 [Mycena sp. CBHHK59/15]|nr:hypothetical protein B0H10DRAFT_1858515 [Mycena sp. CBHHK59/15]